MLMIAAAMEEELEPAKSLCLDLARYPCERPKYWHATLKGGPVCLLKTGVGPARSAANLKEAITISRPSRILLVGYAGALDPEVKLGSMVAVQKALAFSLEDERPSWERVRIEGQFELSDTVTLVEAALAAGLSARSGNTMTSSYVLGDPAHKRLLYEKFHASIVDMETAALARVALSEAIPISCIRAVSDEAADSFLAPFSHNPSMGIVGRAARLLDTGMRETYREWKTHASIAKESLNRFLSRYLDSRFEI